MRETNGVGAIRSVEAEHRVGCGRRGGGGEE